jgi:hypothetical protein
MRLSWFRPLRSLSDNRCGSTMPLVDLLRRRHAIEVIDELHVADAVADYGRGGYDLCVYELDNTAAGAWMWPCLLTQPGLTLLLNSTLATSRAEALARERRSGQPQIERTFKARGDWPLLQLPLLASRTVAVPHRGLATLLAQEYPDARVRTLALPCPLPFEVPSRAPSDELTIGCLDPSPAIRAVVERAVARARRIGVSVTLLADTDSRKTIEDSDIVLDLQWPLHGRPLTGAMTVMGAGRVPIVFDTLESADWPAYNPQTWQRRDAADGRSPVCISIDVRDEEHSLVLCIRRLAVDPELRRGIGTAAHDWWQAHGAPENTVPQFEQLLEEARHSPDPPSATR